MERIFAALEDGYYWLSKDGAYGNPLLNKKIEAMVPTTMSNAPGSKHETVDGGNPLLEHRVAAPTPYTGPERRKDFKKRDEWDRRMMYDVSINSLKEELRKSTDPAERQEIEQEIARLTEMQRDSSIGVTARDAMHDDSGAATGLRRRPDYGESDSLTSTLNRENSKGASAQYVIALDAHNKKASQKGTMYVTAVDWVAGDCLKVAKFAFGPDPTKAMKMGNLTAKAVSDQLNGSLFRCKSHILLAQ